MENKQTELAALNKRHTEALDCRDYIEAEICLERLVAIYDKIYVDSGNKQALLLEIVRLCIFSIKFGDKNTALSYFNSLLNIGIDLSKVGITVEATRRTLALGRYREAIRHLSKLGEHIYENESDQPTPSTSKW